MRTEIINKTKQSFDLKEGNAGAYRFYKQLGGEAKVSIEVDRNATYREYLVATGKKGESIVLTSDDFTEYEVINIEERPGKDQGTVIYESVRIKPRRPGLSRASEPSAGCKSKAEGGSNAGVGSDPAASSAAGVGSVPPASSAAGVASDPPASSAAGAGSVPPASSAAGVGSVPPASSAAGVGSDPPTSSAAGVGSVPPASSAAGAGSDPPALSVASSKPALGISNQNEHVSWYRKLKSRFKGT